MGVFAQTSRLALNTLVTQVSSRVSSQVSIYNSELFLNDLLDSIDYSPRILAHY